MEAVIQIPVIMKVIFGSFPKSKRSLVALVIRCLVRTICDVQWVMSVRELKDWLRVEKSII